MNKDLVFIIAVKKDGQLKKEYDYSIKSWEYWCKKNNVNLFLMEDPVVDMSEMHIIWQRYFLFDMLDHNEINYNQILMVDADTIIHPDAPNFFKETEDKYCLVHDDGSYDWILRGMEHYKKYVFTDEWFEFWKYGNSGFQIVNEKHRPFFDEMRKFYFENKHNIQSIQDKWGIGTDQTPLNYMLRRYIIDIKLLSYEYNMTCMPKKEIINDDMLFTELGYVFHFNGLPDKDNSVPYWMEKTYKYLESKR